MKKYLKKLLLIVLLFLVFASCKYVTYSEDKPSKKYIVKSNVTHPDWAETAVIYKVNLAKYTPEGTINAFMEHLPRLHGMGVEILWLSSIFPVQKKEENEIGQNFYSVRNYMEMDSTAGTKDDLENLIKEAHSLDMFIILDWQPMFISSDNPIAKEHPTWRKATPDEEQVNLNDSIVRVQLNYNNPEVIKYMSDAMKYWVEEFDIDGYQCNNAGSVPCDFWNSVRSELDEIKPVFMIAEDEGHPCLVENAFDMNYGYKLSTLLKEVINGQLKVKELKSYFTNSDSIYEPEIYRMNFTNSLVKNSFKKNGTEQMDRSSEALALLTFTVPGMPLIIEGQNGAADMQLDSLREGTLNWANDKKTKLYKSFIKMKKNHVVFWNGASGGSFEIIDIKAPKHVFTFMRQIEDENAIVILNFSNKSAKFKFKGKIPEGNYFNYFSSLSFDFNEQIDLPPFGYLVLLDEF